MIEAAKPGIAHPPMLSDEAVISALTALSDNLDFFPMNKAGRTLVGNELRAIVGDRHDGPAELAAKLRWLVTRMCQLYEKWPGAREMRLVYSRRYRALDGRVANYPSKVYKRGIPSEQIAAPAPVQFALPMGAVVSADRSIDDETRGLAIVKRMPGVQTKAGRDREEKAAAFERAARRASGD